MYRTFSTLAIAATCSIVALPQRTQAQAPSQVASTAVMSQTLPVGVFGVVGGQITDPRGFGLAGAHVDVMDETTGQSVGIVTGDDGRFSVPGLAVGHRYAMTVRRIGFAPWTGPATPVAHAATNETETPQRVVSLTPIADDYVGLAR